MKWRKRTYIPQTYQHTLKIYDFKAMLNVLNRQLGVVKDKGGNEEGTIGEIIRWWTEHEGMIEFRTSNGKRGEIIPDAFCIYKYTANNRLKLFFLEIDNATMDLEEQLKPKIRRYLECYRSGAWKEKKWARFLPENVFPAVLIVMHSEDDVTALRRYIRSLDTPIRFLLTTYDKLTTSVYKDYVNNSGKTRKVMQDIKINLLEPIWRTNLEEGLVPL
jgi:hypothetical protein